MASPIESLLLSPAGSTGSEEILLVRSTALPFPNVFMGLEKVSSGVSG